MLHGSTRLLRACFSATITVVPALTRFPKCGADNAWAEDADANVGGKLPPQHIGESDYGVLGGRIEAATKMWNAQAVFRRCIEYPGGRSLLDKFRHEGSNAVHYATDIDGKYPI